MRPISVNVAAQIAAAIETGWPLTVIAEKFRVSLSTVKRIKKSSGVVSGARHAELLEAAREGLREALTSEYAANQGAALVRSQVTSSRETQTGIAEIQAALAALVESGETDPAPYQLLHLRAKILSTLSTASKLSADGLRHTLSLAATPENAEELPVLEVRDMLEEEIDALRAKQHADAIAMGIITEDEPEEEANP